MRTMPFATNAADAADDADSADSTVVKCHSGVANRVGRARGRRSGCGDAGGPAFACCLVTMDRPRIDGITFEPSTRTYVASWGSMQFDFFFGTVRVSGPPHFAWLNVDRAFARSITTALRLDCSGGMALALEIQDQY